MAKKKAPAKQAGAQHTLPGCVCPVDPQARVALRLDEEVAEEVETETEG